MVFFLTTCKNMKTISVPWWLTVRNCINRTKALISHAKVPQCKLDDILISKTRHWNYHTAPLKDNITLACILTLASSCSIMRIARVTCSSLCQFKYYSTPCLKGTTIERRASACFNPRKLPQVIQSIQNTIRSIENEWVCCCLRVVPYFKHHAYKT